jgi:hypothetical protein
MTCEYCRTDGSRGGRCACVLPLEQENASTAVYRNAFRKGSSDAGLRDIPANVLSWAMDRAIAAKTPAVTAGRVFADVYYRIQMRRGPRGGIDKPIAYLLATYESELKR